MRFAHINLVVRDPEETARFYTDFVMPKATSEWLGDSLHVRTSDGADVAFQAGTPTRCPGAHHGFIETSAERIDELRDKLAKHGIRITDDCAEQGFRSIKFLDPDDYEIEVYWEADWPVEYQ